MKFENTEVWGFEHALRGMRNPMESWNKSDTETVIYHEDKLNEDFPLFTQIGKNDLELAQKLIKAGSPHRKFLRQIFVSTDITAPSELSARWETFIEEGEDMEIFVKNDKKELI